MTLPEHTYVGTENDWYNTNDIGELIEQVANDKTNRCDIRSEDYWYDDEDEDTWSWD